MPLPTALGGLHTVADRFDAFVIDQWGVVHDGLAPYPGAIDTLDRLTRAGKRVLLLSNSARRTGPNQATLAALGVGPGLYGDIVTSGEATWQALHDRAVPPFDGLGPGAFIVGKAVAADLIESLPYRASATVADADFLLMGTSEAPEKSLADYEEILVQALARGLPAVCANPDRVAVQGDAVIMAAGAIAARYEALGGKVAYIGKPHPPIYALAMRVLGQPDPARVLAIGDSLEHDIAGGNGAGLATLFITGGIHADVQDLAPLYRQYGATPDFTAARLSW
jgi:HAD superfamily hydrolase (TIGR01459 family)